MTIAPAPRGCRLDGTFTPDDSAPIRTCTCSSTGFLDFYWICDFGDLRNGRLAPHAHTHAGGARSAGRLLTFFVLPPMRDAAMVAAPAAGARGRERTGVVVTVNLYTYRVVTTPRVTVYIVRSRPVSEIVKRE